MFRLLSLFVFFLAVASPAYNTLAGGSVKVQCDNPINVNEQIEKIKSKSPIQRALSAYCISKSGPRGTKTIPHLIDIFPDHRKLYFLCESSSGCEKMGASTPFKEAMYALIKIGSPAVQPLIQALKNDNSEIRSGAARTLGRMGNIAAVGPLINALNDPDVFVRKRAVIALGNLKDKRAVEILISRLNNSMPEEKSEVVVALGKLEDQRAVEPLLAYLNQLRSSGKYTWWQGLQPCDALAQIGVLRGVGANTEAQALCNDY